MQCLKIPLLQQNQKSILNIDKLLFFFLLFLSFSFSAQAGNFYSSTLKALSYEKNNHWKKSYKEWKSLFKSKPNEKRVYFHYLFSSLKTSNFKAVEQFSFEKHAYPKSHILLAKYYLSLNKIEQTKNLLKYRFDPANYNEYEIAEFQLEQIKYHFYFGEFEQGLALLTKIKSKDWGIEFYKKLLFLDYYLLQGDYEKASKYYLQQEVIFSSSNFALSPFNLDQFSNQFNLVVIDKKRLESPQTTSLKIYYIKRLLRSGNLNKIKILLSTSQYKQFLRRNFYYYDLKALNYLKMNKIKKFHQFYDKLEKHYPHIKDRIYYLKQHTQSPSKSL